MAAIEVEDLFKAYGNVDAVRGISFEVYEGEVFALLGPNGAGRTTTLEILEGHRRRSGRRINVRGLDPQRGGRAFQERGTSHYPNTTGRSRARHSTRRSGWPTCAALMLAPASWSYARATITFTES